jgi:cystine transport system substrate-binding protein
LLLVIGGVIIVMAILQFSNSPQDTAWVRVKEKGVIVFATDASYPPFSAVDANGNLFGFDVDLAEELARRLGVRAEFENIAYDTLLSAVVSGRDDAVISAFVPQVERQNEALFTQAYFVAGTVAVVRAQSAELRIQNIDWVKWAGGKTLAVEYGAGGDVLARQWARQTSGVSVLPKPTAAEALMAVLNAEADAALVDVVTAYEFLRSHSELMLAGPPVEAEPYALAVKVTSKELFTAFQRTLAEMEEDGSLGELRVKWFGEAAR